MSISLSYLLEYPSIMAKDKVLWIYLFGLWYIPLITSLKITSLDVPTKAWDPVKLNCKYDLEGETLFAVKWYKDGIEFFRCFADGTVQHFPLEDIKIDHTGRSQVGSCFFELTALTQKSGGEYMCEVSLDRPTFRTISSSAHLEIVEPSRNGQPELVTTEDIDSIAVEKNHHKNKGVTNLPSTMDIFMLAFMIYKFY